MSFTWVPFYKELSLKLLEYKNNREKLVEFIYAQDGLGQFSNALHLEDKDQKIDDIDPFSIFGLFNSGKKKTETRIAILERIKLFFEITADIPSDFDGIPVLNYARSFLYDWNDLHNSCESLWNCFLDFMNNNSAEKYINYINIQRRPAESTMPLFWIKPNEYIALDSNNREYLKKNGIDAENIGDYDAYLNLLNQLRSKIENNEINEKSLLDLSYNAWSSEKDNKNYWLIAPGDQAKMWDVFSKNNEIGIGWEDLGDLSLYKDDYEKFKNDYLNMYHSQDIDYKGNGPKQIWDFYKSINIGDVIFARRGVLQIIGMGKVTSDFFYDEKRGEYCQLRKVEWKKIGEWTAPKQTSRDTVHKLRLDQAMEIIKAMNEQENEKNVSLINLLKTNKNIILHGAPGTGKTYLAKQIAKSLNNSELNLTVQGFESFISAPGYLDKHDSSKDKETGTVQRYEKVAAKLLEKYNSFEYIADNAETLRDEMQAERDEAGKPGWDNNQIVVNHIKKYVEFARKENHVDSDDTIGFCQFHPSYDYTDFVEGLRPTKNNGFERKDGTFKAFCKKALQNLIDSKKSVTQIQTELSWQEKIKVFLDDAIENRTVCPLKKNGNVIIESYHDNIVDITLPGNESHKGDTIHISKLLKILSADKTFESAIEIERYLEGFHSAEYSYILAVYKKIKEYSFDSKTTVETASGVKPKNYVFIIDEINRGELSKIFGELFFSVDPSYRGEEGRVNTQYQNLIEDDLFKDGFYIPENVYIIGTMNDIDRSVESMDFAMRRRFTFVEVTAEESAENMNITGEALQKMNAINKVISKMPELGKSYCIGAAYFKDAKDLQKLWDLKISSLVFEYLRGIDNYTDEHKDGEKFDEIKSAYDNPDSVE